MKLAKTRRGSTRLPPTVYSLVCTRVKLPPGLCFSFSRLFSQQKKEGGWGGGIGDFMGLSTNAWGRMSKRRGRGNKRYATGKGVGDSGGKKTPDAAAACSFPLWVCLLAPGIGFSRWPHLVAHCLVTDKCVKTPPTECQKRSEKLLREGKGHDKHEKAHV